MTIVRFSSILLLAVSLPAQSGWRDMDGNALPETESRKSQGGFSASLVVTPDRDWQAKWETPPETVPHFTEADEVSEGGELTILTFLSNPKISPSGMTEVTCDFIVTRPDGSKSVSEINMPCFNYELKTDPTNVYLTAASLKYVAEPSDQRGIWEVAVNVKDLARGVALPLRTSFVVR
ncbi:hypothetical protein [Luteimonas sp. MC1750]|uniref:hypothetical protein n=1 Tax=Luteimonas sp. MC1750 TaxID=2799326 RepID=UPI0018F0602F|nr:hypothetical protein [Luteimonas sp. MC1750]MBJ6985582.1 hypothetical protein [Luteimonas sp. MC1750]QQO05936.1 hypothetical protein JGR68_00265 [Luteimonas sp. MC1750]